MRAHDTGLGQRLVVFDEEQIDHQPDDFARGEVLPGGLVGQFGKLADQFLEDRAHLGIADGIGMEVDVGELLGDEVEQAGLGQLVDLGVKLEALENVAHGRRERLHVGAQVLADVVLVAHELLQVERRGVVEELAGLAQQEGLGIQAGRLAGFLLGQHGGLGGFQHAIQAAQHGEGQDDLAVFGLLVVAAQEVGDGPDEGGKVGIAHGCSNLRRWAVVGRPAGFVTEEMNDALCRAEGEILALPCCSGGKGRGYSST